MTFTLENELPAYDPTLRVFPKIIIILPQEMVKAGNPNIVYRGKLFKEYEGNDAFETAFVYEDSNGNQRRCSDALQACYAIKIKENVAIPRGTQLKFQILGGVENQVSVRTAGKWFVQTQVSLTSLTTGFKNIA